jgi:hypothetical protein
VSYMCEWMQGTGSVCHACVNGCKKREGVSYMCEWMQETGSVCHTCANGCKEREACVIHVRMDARNGKRVSYMCQWMQGTGSVCHTCANGCKEREACVIHVRMDARYGKGVVHVDLEKGEIMSVLNFLSITSIIRTVKLWRSFILDLGTGSR